MKVAFFDCFAGASGDMILGALLDAGLPFETLQKELAKLNLSHYQISVAKTVKNGIGGSQVRITVDQNIPKQCRNLGHIKAIIENSNLDPAVKEKSIAIFVRLAEAEARVHHSTIESVHFHEVGAMDAIIDIVGSVIGLSLLGIERIICSPIHVGHGTVRCEHGILPLPAPATMALLKEKPIYATGVRGELLTPTGAAILTTLASDFGPMPTMTIQRVGYGVGTADFDIPNLLRLIVGDAEEERLDDGDMEDLVVIETNIDDMNPQLYDYLIERLLNQGACDVFLTPVQMKKNRPGILLSVTCRPDSRKALVTMIMEETTTIGARCRSEKRIKAEREICVIDTDYGPVRVKVAKYHGRIINISPEYDDCKRVSVRRSILHFARPDVYFICLMPRSPRRPQHPVLNEKLKILDFAVNLFYNAS